MGDHARGQARGTCDESVPRLHMCMYNNNNNNNM